MTVNSYLLTPRSDSSSPSRSSGRTAGTTSCQILLSRGVSDVSDPFHPQADTEAPRMNTVTVFESPSHHIMALAEPPPLGRAESMEADATTQSQEDVERGARPPIQTSLDGSMTNLLTPPIEISTPSVPQTSYLDAQSSQAPASAPITPSWTRTPLDALESEPCKTDVKGKGKELDRGRTSDRTGRAANPLIRAESHPRRLDPTFELISHPIPIRPLPIERTTGHLSRSSTFYKDPTDPCATLDDQLLEQCPRTPTIPLAEMLDQPAEILIRDGHSETPDVETETPNSEPGAIDTPSPLTGIFRSDSNGLYELTITKIPDEKPTLYPAPTLPLEIISRVLPNVSHLEYLALKSSAKEWSESPYNVGESEMPMQPVDAEKLQFHTRERSIMGSLPVEIILQIYYLLHPSDFNAVRRINRRWFISSLDKGLLQTMLRRGGWSGCREWDLTANSIIDDEDERRVRVNAEWIMSKKIARECALGPEWTGNGLVPLLAPILPGSLDIPDTSTNQETQGSKEMTAFRLTTVTDFTEIGIHYPSSTPGTGASGAGTLFTVSMCGRFLMAATGCLIYIYELNRSNDSSPEDRTLYPGELRPVTSIICPRRVLACSMDTSSFRYAIAVLLDGRMGMVCDITAPGTGSPKAKSGSSMTIAAMGGTYSQTGPSLGRGNVHYGPTIYRNNVTIKSSTSNAFERAVTEKPFVFPVITADKSQRPSFPGPSASDFQEAAWQDMLHGDLPDTSIKSLPGSRRTSNHTNGGSSQYRRSSRMTRPFSTATQANMPLEYGPRSIYRNLCSDDDPPRSVAICPQRRCVAFGCSAGIELHWVDALTGQDLNRWFPLTAPSDFLFFLPPRRGIDSAKKLRLISSAASPTETAALAERFRSSSVTARMRNSSKFHNATNGSAVTQRRTDDSDHYRAVPLSDGYHILFTNPVTGVLCLGSDAPIGGPMKLLRKIWFMGPIGNNRNRPVAYAGGSDLNEGVRVVAAYDNPDGVSQSIWLFSVPCDVFKDSQVVKSDEGEEKGKSEWREWWEEDFTEDDWRNPENAVLSSTSSFTSTPSSSSPRWPIQVRGQEIGNCIGVIDLAIQSGPELTIWAFTRTGIAFVWQVDDGNLDFGIERRVVMRDGTIREIDDDGDTVMRDRDSDMDSMDVELPTPGYLLSDPMQESFDGTASYYSQFNTHGSPPPPYQHQEYGSERENSILDEQIQVTHNVDRVDGDGDVLMDDLPDIWVRISEFADEVDVESSGDESSGQGRALYRSTRWRGRYIEEVAGGGADLVEELTGVARMEVEIH